MNLENHVTSLELSKRLKELGVKQESEFYWNQIKLKIQSSSEKYELSSIAPIEKFGAYSPFKFYSAYLASELGEMLPLELNSGRYVIEKGDGFFELRFYEDAEQDLEGLYDWHDEEYTEANARAKMLIYLLENKLITLGE